MAGVPGSSVMITDRLAAPSARTCQQCRRCRDEAAISAPDGPDRSAADSAKGRLHPSLSAVCDPHRRHPCHLCGRGARVFGRINANPVCENCGPRKLHTCSLHGRENILMAGLTTQGRTIVSIAW